MTDVRAELAALVEEYAPVVPLPDGVYIGAAEVDGQRVKRRAFVCRDLAEAAARLLGVPMERDRPLVRAVTDVTWQDGPHTSHGRERRWFTTEEMVDAILAAAGHG